jgi:hypothetical protein
MGLIGHRIGVWRLVLLTVITCFIYYPVWFLKLRSGLNNIRDKKRVGLVIPVAATVVLTACILAVFVDGVLEGMMVKPKSLDWVRFLSSISEYIICLTDLALLVEVLRVRRLLLDEYEITISLMPTLLLGIFYLQYKINRLFKSERPNDG